MFVDTPRGEGETNNNGIYTKSYSPKVATASRLLDIGPGSLISGKSVQLFPARNLIWPGELWKLFRPRGKLNLIVTNIEDG